MSFRNHQGGEVSKPLINNNAALYSSPYSTIPNSSSLPSSSLEEKSSSCTKWKEQVKGWRRITSHILAIIIILSVLGFAGAYFGEHDLKGAPTWKLGLLMLVSVSFGFVLIQGAFGFGAHFRVLYKQQYEPVMIELREESEDEEKKMKNILPPSKVLPQFSTMQAHAVMIAIATFLFSMLYIIDKAAGWKMYAPEASPMTISIILGGFLFGFGMQLGDACASGTLFTIGAGSLWSVYLLVFFVAGSVIATALQSAGDWNISFPNHVGLSLLFPGAFLKKGYGIAFLQKHAWLEYLIAVFAMCTQITILLAFAIGVHFYNKRKQKEASREGLINQVENEEVQLSTSQKIKEFFSNIIFKLIYGPWDIMSTGIALAFFNFFFLLITQHPMGLTGPFAIIGCKILDAIAPNLNVPGWSAWKGTDLRKANMLFNPNFILDFGIVYGAIIATLLKGKFPSFLDGMSLKSFAPKRTDENGDRASVFFTISNYISRFVDWIKDNFGIAIAKIIGGIAMGIGAKFGYGCNIGAYFSGVSCMSIHGYTWIIMALFGGYLGAVARPYFGYKKRKVACGVCESTLAIH